ncbi:MAG: cupredoxin domain-containing protein [Dehalococcoidia bacterium]
MSGLIALLIVSACGGDAAQTSAGTDQAAPASTATGTAGGSLGVASGSAATPANGSSATSAGPVSALTIVATDNIYTPAEFQVRAGEEFSVTLENHGQAIHDWRVRDVPNAEGKDAGTALLPTGQSQTIALTIEQPGDYAYYCEVHPVEMRGTLVVR